MIKKGVYAAGKLAGKGASSLGKMTGITESLGLNEIPGVDIKCDYLNTSMAEINYCYFHIL